MKGKGKNKSTAKIKNEFDDDSSLGLQQCNTAERTSVEYTSFANVLQRKESKDITVSDLKAVQYTLEHMMVSGMRRSRVLESKINSLEVSMPTKKDKRSRSTDSVDKKISEERTPKKVKESTSKASSSQVKGQYLQVPFAESHLEPLRTLKEGPSRFWTLIEPYCTEITQDTIRMLEDWIKPNESDEEYEKIPDLGEHYSVKWFTEDLMEELKEGSKSIENNKGLFSGSAYDYDEIEKLVKAGETVKTTINFNQDCSLQDRIVCSLVSENLMTPMHENLSQACLDDDDGNQRINPNAPLTSTAPSCDTLQERLLKGLVEAGLLDRQESPDAEKDDEVLAELKRLHNALVPMQNSNLRKKKMLLTLAKQEMLRQEAKKKLQEHDVKVMELYRNVSVARKTGTMNKKLEDQVKRTLRERKKLAERVSNML